MERQILHIDVNNAFLSWAAVERLKNGEALDIRDIPAVIGGDETRRAGIVLAKSMPAKRYGIKTAETIYSAKRKCPDLRIFPSCDYSVYKEYSNKLYNMLLEYTDKIERFSIDECFMDMTGYLMKDTLINKAYEISKRVKQEFGFTVNIGVAHNKLLAKMASDFEKPDKVHTLFENEIEEKMWRLPVAELFMLGKKTVPRLNLMQINTIGDLAKADKEIIIKKFGKHGLMMWEYANGIDEAEVVYIKEKPKSIGNSITLPYDVREKEKLEEILLALTEQVAYRLRKQEMLANVVSVELRTKAFKDTSHQKKLYTSASNTKEIYQVAKKLLDELFIQGMAIRLVGVKVDNLIEKDQKQLSLFDSKENEKQDTLESTIDKLKEKYGYNLITRAGRLNAKDIINIRKKE
ncbi:MAG: DNA polymerase IV [Clostridia bacterium]|nr:DNA polymerase IV [Clostridia bacterium]